MDHLLTRQTQERNIYKRWQHAHINQSMNGRPTRVPGIQIGLFQGEPLPVSPVSAAWGLHRSNRFTPRRQRSSTADFGLWKMKQTNRFSIDPDKMSKINLRPGSSFVTQNEWSIHFLSANRDATKIRFNFVLGPKITSHGYSFKNCDQSNYIRKSKLISMLNIMKALKNLNYWKC